MTLYKVTELDGTSCHGGHGRWTLGRWRSVSGDLIACQRGLHLSRERDLVDWLGPVIWEAEVHPDAAMFEAPDKLVVSKARVIRRLDTWDERTARLFAADCAEHVVHLCGDDPRPREAIEAARRYAEGKVTYHALDAAWAAARDAAWAAADAAAAAARDAGWAAADAGWAAADAAVAAARDAGWAAARAAARDAAAAADAAWHATWAIARAAVKIAAWDTEREWQTARLMTYLRGEA
jgi:hypothetical protein